ncbi:ribonuclease 2-like isoform X1 [Neltuma alba]|uniref:ribonuclease 2-like isoform X1 n=1 Tax=Neltuma alba TaxID=207710 RepID=UPI0010A3840C|nr:ribonuclease 2-like isoform X1 [Prosopis alba]
MASFSGQTRIIALPWLLLAIIGGSLCARKEVNGSIEEANQREFDYFALALQWPVTYCRRTRHCCSSNACCRGSNAPTEFTIHGLWPDYNDGSWPSCCSRTSFDEKEISTLTNALEQYWPSLSCGSPSTCHGTRGSFWAHEWETHGTCSFPVIRDEYNYFLTTLNVYFKYNVTRVLNEAGYVPSNREKYPLGGIVSAIENAFHTTPQVVCSHGAVEEIRLCFYKDFKPRDCGVASDIKIDMVTSRSSCPKYVSLPVHVSSGETLFHMPLLINIALVAFTLVFLLAVTDGPLQWIEVF